MTAQQKTRCVYLTSSTREAVKLHFLVAKADLRLHCATSLDKALLLLKVVDAKVLIVDYAFPGGGWSDAIIEASRRCPGTAVIVAVPARLAAAWEEIIPAGGYEVVLKPFALAELAPIVRNADEYARTYWSDCGRKAR